MRGNNVRVGIRLFEIPLEDIGVKNEGIPEGTELELAGGMPFGTTDAVKKFLDAAPAVQVIHLNSQGGRINEAYKLYQPVDDVPFVIRRDRR